MFPVSAQPPVSFTCGKIWKFRRSRKRDTPHIDQDSLGLPRVSTVFRSRRPSISSVPSYQSGSSNSSGITKCSTYSSRYKDEAKTISAVSFDGGGVRGASSARIMQIILADLSEVTGKDESVHEQFDMVAGTSTGGLIALMLGRLRVPIGILLSTYPCLSQRLFQARFKYIRSIFNGSKYSGSRARQSYEAIVELHEEAGRGATLREESQSRCDVFVTAISILDTTGEPVILRSYDIEQSYTIAEAAQATTAAPAYFPPKKLSTGDIVVDGGVRFNNPTELLFQEARRKYGRGVKFRLLLSIGTGEKSPIIMKRCRSGVGLISLPKTMGQIMTDSEAVHQRMQARFEEADLGTYVRINVPRVGDIILDDFRSIPSILKATDEFMGTPEMLAVRRDIVEMLLEVSEAE